ncbi:MAG: P1 family peptidase [Euryarchaeota archaeon]|nr:P1 family peptidase [Euryarchaeota archaeon]
MDLYKGYLTDVPGIIVGHAQDPEGVTGVTVAICEKGAGGGVDVRGSAPGTRETDLFQAEKTVDKVHAIVLSGSSAFGLSASSGVADYLAEKKIGFEVQGHIVPIVAQAVIFDLAFGNPDIKVNAMMGYEAAKNASSEENRQGNIGAGTGATVGKILGNDSAMKAGLGSASLRVRDLIVSAMVVVNALGDVFDLDNQIIAGAKNPHGQGFLNTAEFYKKSEVKMGEGNTTIGIIATNAKLSKAGGNKTAQLAQNAFARRIVPAHTAFDGDTIFVMATGEVESDITLVGILAVEAMEKAIINAVKSVKD